MGTRDQNPERASQRIVVRRSRRVSVFRRQRQSLRRAVRVKRPGRASVRRHHALEVASHLLGTMLDVDETFQRLVEILARELHSRRVSLMRLDRESGFLEMRAAVGVTPEVMAQARARIGEGIAGTCARLGQPLYVDDHARVHAGDADLTEFLPGGAGAPMSLTVPILVKGEVLGVVNITDRADDRPYTERDITFASALMAHAGYLLENAGLVAHIDGLRGFLQRVLDAIGDPLAVVDSSWCLVDGNKAFFTRFGGEPGSELAAAVGATQAQMDALLADSDEVVDWALDQDVYDMSVTRVEGAEAGRLVVLFHDVTGRRQMERRLLSAEKMASLGVLSAGVAHEINNPMTFVKSNTLSAGEYFSDLLAVMDAWRAAAQGQGTCETARRLEQDLCIDQIRDDASGLVKETAEGVERVQRIVASLRGFAHPDNSQTHAADLRTLVENAILLTQGQWKYKLDIVRDFADQMDAIHCLPNQIEQVFMNLITNAAQAADTWGRLTIRIRSNESGALVEFEDDCGGIPAHLADRIFEPFFTTKDIGKGTGLGLSISYNIVAAHGGVLAVETSAGDGSVFSVELPIGEANRPLVVQQHSTFRA